MIHLESLFPSAQRPRLCEAIFKRYSCRAYAGAPAAGDWAPLNYAAQRYQLPGARLRLLHADESLFTGNLLGVGRITGCTSIAAVIASASHDRSRIHAGILGEAFCLEATALGLATCWVSGTYRKKALTIDLAPDEAVLAIIAFGIPSDMQPKIVRKRKPIDKLIDGDPAAWPEELRRVAEAVREAPSAMNMQPWEMHLSGSRLTINAADRAQIELGVALCHAELILGTPHTWQYGASRKETAAWAQPK